MKNTTVLGWSTANLIGWSAAVGAGVQKTEYDGSIIVLFALLTVILTLKCYKERSK